MRFSRPLGVIALILTPLIALLLIVKYGVNVPYWDEWTTPGAFLTGDRFAFKDFFDQSNESRLVIPKLIFLGFSKVAGWQPKHYMVFGWLIVLAVFLLHLRLCYLRPARGRGLDLPGFLCVALACGILFSPAAYENWLWGLQWVIFVPLLCALIAFSLQSRMRSPALRLTATVILNGIAMYSFSNGMILWIVSFPFWKEAIRLLAGRNAPRGTLSRLLLWSAAYVLIAAVAIRTYFAGYQTVSAHPPLAYVLREPWNVIKYFAAWCGGPFDAGSVVRIVIGFVLIAGVCVLFGYAVKRARLQPGARSIHLLRMLYPSLLIVAYACASGAMTALGRAGFGYTQAFSSRYLFHSGALAVGLLSALNTHRILGARPAAAAQKYGRAILCTVLVVTVFVFRGWRHGWQGFEMMHIARTQTLLNVRMLGIAPTSPLVTKTCPWLDLPDMLAKLRARGLYSITPFGTWLGDALRTQRREGAGNFRITRTADALTFTGWGIIPDQAMPADAVLICKKEPSGELHPWMMLAVGFESKDARAFTGERTALKSGFLETFPWTGPGDFPPVELFAVDERGSRLFPLAQLP